MEIIHNKMQNTYLNLAENKDNAFFMGFCFVVVIVVVFEFFWRGEEWLLTPFFIHFNSSYEVSGKVSGLTEI